MLCLEDAPNSMGEIHRKQQETCFPAVSCLTGMHGCPPSLEPETALATKSVYSVQQRWGVFALEWVCTGGKMAFLSQCRTPMLGLTQVPAPSHRPKCIFLFDAWRSFDKSRVFYLFSGSSLLYLNTSTWPPVPHAEPGDGSGRTITPCQH
jgi:hypothetical protein